jgi:hypothetical protein
MAMRDFWPVRTLAAALMASSMSTVAMAEQNLTPVLNAGADKALKFDWPMLQIGTGEYTEGPTGVTVFRFGRKVLGAVDVRGGAPGTVNTDYLRLGYEKPELDAVVLSGGSFYGLESTTAVASALKDDNVRRRHRLRLRRPPAERNLSGQEAGAGGVARRAAWRLPAGCPRCWPLRALRRLLRLRGLFGSGRLVQAGR